MLKVFDWSEIDSDIRSLSQPEQTVEFDKLGDHLFYESFGEYMLVKKQALSRCLNVLRVHVTLLTLTKSSIDHRER
jgi:hypothetical protein